MNRPRLVGILSAVLGSTVGFLVLSRWSLAGTVTGAILMPVIFTLVSFCSHESMERASKWFGCRMKKGSVPCPPETPKVTEDPVTGPLNPGRRSVQWSVVALAFLALAVSLYSLTQDQAAGITILRDTVVETVTVTSEVPVYSVAHANTTEASTVTTVSQVDADQATTTTLPQDDQADTTATTDTTMPDPAGPTTTIP